jgi:hypothetical protein
MRLIFFDFQNCIFDMTPVVPVPRGPGKKKKTKKKRQAFSGSGYMSHFSVLIL